MNAVIEANETNAKIAHSNRDYNVITEPLFLKDGTPSKFVATVREDTRIALGVVTEKYQVIQNREITSNIESSFQSRGMSFQKQNFVTRDGARFFCRYDIRDQKMQIPEVGDFMGLRILMRNSFDKSSLTTFAVEFLRLVCKNGMVRSDMAYSMRQMHVGYQPEELGAQVNGIINLCMEGWSEVGKRFSLLAGVDVRQEQGARLISTMSNQKLFSNRIEKRIQDVWANPTLKEDRPRNFYNIYNAVTQVLTHEVEEKRFELAHKVNHQVSDSLFDLAAKIKTLKTPDALDNYLAQAQKKEEN